MQKKVPKRSIWLLPAILARRLARVGRYFSESGQLLQIATCRFSYPATARQTMGSLTPPQVTNTLSATLAANKTFNAARQRIVDDRNHEHQPALSLRLFAGSQATWGITTIVQ